MFKKLLSVVKKEKVCSTSSFGEPPLSEKKEEEEESPEKIKLSPDLFEVSLPDLDFNIPIEGFKRMKCEGIQTVYYHPEILSEAQETKLISAIDSVNEKEWVKLTFANRKLLKLGGDVTSEGLKHQEQLPTCFAQISDEIYNNLLCPKKPNHVLLNNYPRGVGIMSHFDGPLYYPWVNSISIGSTCLIKFTKQPEGEVLLALLERRSLLIFTEDAYDKYQHGIDDAQSDTIHLAVVDDANNLDSRKQLVQIKSSNIINLRQTRLYEEISKMTLEEAVKSKLLIPNEDSTTETTVEYNYCIELPRENRMSLTIRNVPVN